MQELTEQYLLFASVARASRGRDGRLLRDGSRELTTGACSIS